MKQHDEQSHEQNVQGIAKQGHSVPS